MYFDVWLYDTCCLLIHHQTTLWLGTYLFGTKDDFAADFARAPRVIDNNLILLRIYETGLHSYFASHKGFTPVLSSFSLSKRGWMVLKALEKSKSIILTWLARPGRGRGAGRGQRHPPLHSPGVISFFSPYFYLQECCLVLVANNHLCLLFEGVWGENFPTKKVYIWKLRDRESP